MLIVSFALAAPLDDGALRKLVSERAGQPIPEALFCVARPALDAPFAGELAAVGVQMKGVGCRLQAVAVDGALVDPRGGLAASIGTPWAELGPDQRAEAAQRWVREVLLAFDQLDEGGTATVEGDGILVTQPFHQRAAGANLSRDTQGRWRFDAAGNRVEEDRDNGPTFQAELVTKHHGGRGLTEAQVADAIAARGALFHGCVREAFEADFTLQDRARVRWEVADGKTLNVSAKGDTPDELLRCYGGVLARMEFPAELAGFTEWTFAVVRSPAQ